MDCEPHTSWDHVKARRAALATGPDLADTPAALACTCSCHPRPADPQLHDGGTDCPCQLSPDARAERQRQALDTFAALGEQLRPARDAELVALDRRAADLGVTARLASWAAPMVVAGHCDGHGFYLRERHGTYDVTVATNPGPDDLWGSSDRTGELDVATGPDADLYDADDPGGVPARALTVAVAAVRRHLLVVNCTHADRGTWAFCPACGTPAD